MARWPLSREQPLSDPTQSEAAVENMYDALWPDSGAREFPIRVVAHRRFPRDTRYRRRSLAFFFGM